MQLLDCKAELPFKALPFPLFLSVVPSEVIVDRRHGWVMSALSSGNSGVFRGPVRLGSSSRWETVMVERGRNSSLLFCFDHVSAKEGDTGCLLPRGAFVHRRMLELLEILGTPPVFQI